MLFSIILAALAGYFAYKYVKSAPTKQDSKKRKRILFLIGLSLIVIYVAFTLIMPLIGHN